MTKKKPPAPPADGQPTYVTPEMVERAMLNKVDACRRAIIMLAIPPPAVADRDGLVYSLGVVARDLSGPAQAAGIALMLDWCAPGWEGDDPELYGILTGRRDDARYMKWRRLVLERDGHACQARGCGCRQHLHAHHIVRWADSHALRYVVGNGVTLCADHHKQQHRDMGVRLWEN